MLGCFYTLVDGRPECKPGGEALREPIKDVMHPSGQDRFSPPTGQDEVSVEKAPGRWYGNTHAAAQRRRAPGHRDSGHPASRRGRRRRRRQ